MAKKLLPEILTRPAYEAHFILMPLMHSEDINDHHLMNDALKRMIAHEEETGNTAVVGTTQYFVKFLKDHSDVVERFGRYPTRNEFLGRQSTDEEIEFLKTATRW